MTSSYLQEGLRLFREGEFFNAHEIWEEHWITAPEEERDFYQGLIHTTIALHHAGRGNFRGARLQFQKALRRLSSYSGTREGIDIDRLRAYLAQAARSAEEGVSPPPPAL